MASLTHVNMWTGHEWKSVSAEEASSYYPLDKVTANSGLFRCALCMQNVTLTCGEKRVRYFKHSRGENDKSCPERTFGPNYKVSFCEKNHGLPLRINIIGGKDFSLEIGLVPLPQNILDEYADERVVICPEGIKEHTYIYNFDRLRSDSTTFVSVGRVPAKQYDIISSMDSIRAYWPEVIEGVESEGKLFDTATNRMLAADSDVVVNKEYYLLCSTTLYSGYKDISVEKICEKKNSWDYWKIYRVMANNLSNESAKFFWDIHYRLTDSPLRIQQIWPVYSRSVDTNRCRDKDVYIHIVKNNEVSLKTVPNTTISEYETDFSKGRIIELDCNDHQMIFAGRGNVIRNLCICRDTPTVKREREDVNVTDVAGNIIEQGTNKLLPHKNTIEIKIPFDGIVIIKMNSIIIDERDVKSNESMSIQRIKYGFAILIYQGLDLVWTSSFKRDKEQESNTEELLIERLNCYKNQFIEIPYSMKQIYEKMYDYPNIQKWIYKVTRKGKIPQDAYLCLRKFVCNLKTERRK